MPYSQLDDYHWFLENYSDLYEKFGTTYMIIKNKTVIGLYPTFGEAVRTAELSETPGSFIVQYCNGSESGYTDYIASTNFMGDMVQ